MSNNRKVVELQYSDTLELYAANEIVDRCTLIKIRYHMEKKQVTEKCIA